MDSLLNLTTMHANDAVSFILSMIDSCCEMHY